MLNRGDHTKQEIHAHFSTPNRSINPARIAEIHSGESHIGVVMAPEKELVEFLTPTIKTDPFTGLDLRRDELLIKAREAMIAGIQIYNGANLTFRTEIFIVTAIIAWVYLLHYWYSQEGIDFRYRKRDNTVEVLKDGSDRVWDLRNCLKQEPCPLPTGVVRNLEFLLDLRNEIEHKSTSRIDEAIISYLQACCLNFNKALKKLFGDRCAIESQVPIALQLTSFGSEQRGQLKNAQDLPPNLESFIKRSQKDLTEQDLDDPSYQYRVSFVRMQKNRSTGADEVILFVKPESEDEDSTQVYIRQIQENRYPAGEVRRKMIEKGFTNFSISAHTKLWQSLDGKNPAKKWGRKGDYPKTWVWNDRWIKVVLKHCQDNRSKYEAT